MSEVKSPKARSKNAEQWDLCHKIINMARKAKGLPLSKEENPYLFTKAANEK